MIELLSIAAIIILVLLNVLYHTRTELEQVRAAYSDRSIKSLREFRAFNLLVCRAAADIQEPGIDIVAYGRTLHVKRLAICSGRIDPNTHEVET